MIHRPTNSDYWEHDPDDDVLWGDDQPELGIRWLSKPCENFDDEVEPPHEELSA